MSDEDRDIDIESDAEKRAHHNALERKRRDHIKDSFTSLRDSVPALQGEKASRAQILKKAAEYIQFMRRKNHSHQADIDDLKKQNQVLEEQNRQMTECDKTEHPCNSFAPVSVRSLERGKTNFSSILKAHGGGVTVSAFDGGSGSDTSDSETHSLPKKMKTAVAV